MPPLGDERSIGELKDLVVQTLETNGVLGHIRAELRAHVYKAIEQEEQTTAAAASKLLRMPEGRLMAELVREFFEFYGFKHSLSVFLPESSLGREGRSREAVALDAGLSRVEQGRSALEQILELAAGQEETRKGGLLSCGSSTTASTPPPSSAMAARVQGARDQGPDQLQQLKASPSTAPKAQVAPAAQEESAGEVSAAACGPAISFEERAQLDRQMARQMGRRQGNKAAHLAPLAGTVPAAPGDDAPPAPPAPETTMAAPAAPGVAQEEAREELDASARPSSPGSASGSQPGGAPQQASPAASASPVASPAASPAASNRSAGSQRSQASQASSHARSSRSSAASSQGSRSSRGPSAPEQVQSFRSDSDLSRQRSPAGPSDSGTPASRSGASGGLLGAGIEAADSEESVSVEDSGGEDVQLVGGAGARGAGAGAGVFQASDRASPPVASRRAAVAEDVDELESIEEDFSNGSSIEGYPESDANRSNEEAP